MEEDFRRLWADYNRHVLAYALRRTEQRSDAEDVVSATFTVAWRRFGDKPAAEFELPWLYAIAARVLANQRRSVRRLVALRGPVLRPDMLPTRERGASRDPPQSQRAHHGPELFVLGDGGEGSTLEPA